MVFVYALFLYFVIVFVGIPLLVPFYSYSNTDPDPIVPSDFLKIIEKINMESKSNLDYLHKSYDYLTNKYYGSRIGFLYDIKASFSNIFSKKNGLLPCNIFNELLKIMLIKSGRFTNSGVKRKIVFLNFFIHQYLSVKVGDKWIIVDPTYSNMGIKFGNRAIFFV